MPQPSNAKGATRKFMQVYCHEQHRIIGYKELEMPATEKTVDIGPNHITTHEGSKYLRTIGSAVTAKDTIEVDVYEVLLAFNVSDPAIAHAVKKLLCCGQRGKGDAIADLNGAIAAIKRAINFRERDLRFGIIEESGT